MCNDITMNGTAFGPFGHTLRTIALASNDVADIRRWNDYAIALEKKLEANERVRKMGTPAAAIMAHGFHQPR
jgi:hypothetical protein